VEEQNQHQWVGVEKWQEVEDQHQEVEVEKWLTVVEVVEDQHQEVDKWQEVDRG